MVGTITVNKQTYYHYSEMVPKDGTPSPLAGKSEKRKAFSSNKKAMKLGNTVGAYVGVGPNKLLIVVDKDTVAVGSPEWELIAKCAAHLEGCYPNLTPQAVKALANLRAVVFSKKPERSFADVKPNIFMYDADELSRRDGKLNHPPWVVSCIVHDANHIWQYRNKKPWTGDSAETECWRLQVENGAALGLSDIDIEWLNEFIADPGKLGGRAEAPTFKKGN
jgi:hypothetical protein